MATNNSTTTPAPSATQASFDALGQPLIATTFVVLDLETTGLSAADDRITEIGAVKVRGGEVLGELRTFVHPQRPIPPAVTAITGINDATVRDAPTIAAVLPSVLRFLEDAVLVAHNAGFDLAFLRAAAGRLGAGPLDPPVVDTARLARRLLRDEVRDVRLATVARHLRARVSPDHRALTDARATVDVLHGLIERAGSFGATTLEDLQQLTRSSSERSFRRRDLVADAPAVPGVYRFLDADDRVLYIGKATDLRSRLRTYFGQDPRRRMADLVRGTARVAWTPTPTVLEAEIHELRAIREHQPRYNRRSRDGSAPVFLALTDEPFPRLSIVRSPRPSHPWTFGPLRSRRLAEQVIASLTEIVPLRTCTPRLRLAQDHGACVLKDLGRCGAPCDGSQSQKAYAEVVDTALATLLEPSDLLHRLRQRMTSLAADGRFERAAETRTQLHGVARALLGVRRRAVLADVERLVAARPTADGTELVVLRRGRLEATALLTPDQAVLGPGREPLRDLSDVDLSDDDLGEDGLGEGDRSDSSAAPARRSPQTAQLIAALTLPGPSVAPRPQDTDELDLALTWLDRPGVQLVHVDGTLASPVAAGAALTSTVAESRQVERDRRRDHQTLSGQKVRRRAG